MRKFMGIVAGIGAVALCGAWFGGASAGNAAEAQLSVGPASGPVSGPSIRPVARNPIVREPVLIYDYTGGTLIGTFHRNVVVYNDGFVAFARKDNVVFPMQMEVEDVETGDATRAQVKRLIEKLTEAGAFKNHDGTPFIQDVPLTTVTFIPQAGTNATAHTYSTFSGGGTDVDLIVDNFVDIVLGM